ncbi:MAG TPA: zinc-ribbon domain-containing protein [Candidatus Limnocylindrales bacterium]|nr:zinc-ribbon domain-containing protein [Candidatus Limnocylindrales bacterium]
MHPGDIICAVCGTPNDPSRRFCRHCGNSLATAVPAARAVPWWRRLFQRKPKAATLAGDRPKRLGDEGQQRPGVLSRLVPLVLVALIAFGATSLVVMPSARSFVADRVNDVRLQFFGQISDIHPTAAQGAGVGANTGSKAVDDNTATFWLADPSKGAPTLTASFGTTFNLGGLVLHSGSTTQSDFTKHRRPKTIELSFPGTTAAAIQVSLADTADPQPMSVDVRSIQTVVVKVLDWYESGAGGDQLVAIREIEFKERS